MHKFRLLIQLSLLTWAGSTLAADDGGPARKLLENLDTNGDKLISLMEFQARENNALTVMDTDLNGVLTIDEFINARPNMGMRMGRGEPRGDRDTDAPRGQREPSAEQMARMQAMRSERATARFTAMDADADEVVTLAEFQAGTFAELDRNDDSVLDINEMRRPPMNGPRGERQRAPREMREPRAPRAQQDTDTAL